MNLNSAADLMRAYKCPPILISPLYQEPGTADAVVSQLEKADPESATLARAFLLYYRGDITAGAVEARKLLGSECRLETTLGLSQVLSLEALCLGNSKKWNEARALAAKCDYVNNEEYHLKQINLASLDFTLFVKTTLPSWFREGCFDPMPVECYGVMRYLYAKLLYIESDFSKLAAVVEPMISQSHAEKALLSEVYLRIIAAMGRYCTGEIERSESHLYRALELALPDRLYAPFGEYRRHLGSALERMFRKMAPEAFKNMISFSDTIREGWTKLYNDLYGKKYSNDLTPREYDTAHFALLGMTNGEIADKMGISINTVKLYLRNIYEKLGINRRNELAPYIWEEL